MIFKNNNEIRYTYDASGRKIKVQYLSALGSGFFPIADQEADKLTLVALQSESEVFYCGEWILGKDKKGRLRLIRELFDGGFQQGGRNYYFVRNHLGSNVALASFNDAGEMTVEQRNSYSAFGLQMLSESDSVSVKTAIQPYKYCGKEFERMNGFDAYDFGARFYDPEIGRFLSIDPLAEKSPNISPYAYCANNPVRYIDPDGRKVRGITKQDAQKFRDDIYKVLADDKFANVRTLIDIKGKTFKAIDACELNSAMEGLILTDDESAYITMITGAINSKDVYKVEYVSGEYTSSEGAKAFVNHMNKELGEGMGDKMVTRDGKLSSAWIRNSGDGLNVPTQNGSHSFISGSLQGSERVVTSGHEVFGHGIPAAKKLTPTNSLWHNSSCNNTL